MSERGREGYHITYLFDKFPVFRATSASVSGSAMISPAMNFPTSSCSINDIEWKAGESTFKHDQDVVMPGFRFHPTEEELVEFYLRRKVEGKHFNIELIASIDLYRYDPWDLPALASIGEKEWFFYVRRNKKYRNGDRPNRVTASGYWKATGADRTIRNEVSCCIGSKKTLVFYKGKAPKGKRTSWMMNEYRLPQLAAYGIIQKRELSLCRVYKRSGGSEEGRQQAKERRKTTENHEDPEMHHCQTYMACSNPGTMGESGNFRVKDGDKDEIVKLTAERFRADMESGVPDQLETIEERIYIEGGNVWNTVCLPVTLNEDLEPSLTTSFMYPRATDQLVMAEDLYTNNPCNLVLTNALTSGGCLPTCLDKLWEWNPAMNSGNGACC